MTTGRKLYKSIIFDLDGTLMDTKPGIIECLGKIIERHGLKPIKKSQEMKFIGPPMRLALKAHYGLSDDDAFNLAQEFRELYAQSYALKADIYPSMVNLLQDLKDAGCRLSVATYKREDVARELLEHSGLAKFFDIIKGSDFDGKLTKRDIVENAINAVSVSAKNTVIVGDSPGDGSAAKQVGAEFIAVTYGFGFRDEKDFEGLKPLARCSKVAEIFDSCYKKARVRKVAVTD